MYSYAEKLTGGVKMARSVIISISRKKSAKVYRWYHLALDSGYEKWKLSTFIRDRLEDVLETVMNGENVEKVDVGSVWVMGNEMIDGKSSEKLYLLPSGDNGYPCIRAYVDYLANKGKNFSVELCRLIERDISECSRKEDEYVPDDLYDQNAIEIPNGFISYARRRKLLINTDNEDHGKEDFSDQHSDQKETHEEMKKEKSVSTEEMKEEDLFGFF